ncbi:type VI secretion system Vgr family protein [Vibrio algivorus]|uniref:Type VI secretion system tip protein VgrG n=1 Tax=Vibrio algivorus TaxID=1667024 RepID=A0A557P5B4_9VIBR|nr:type VI secretion system tip protein TssI/VgrG [Vibrio algivorus]TVO35860.1 type VI secretion system tip protein VgrG [Vibrio algivorus]
MATLQFSLRIDGVSEDALSVVSFDGHDNLCSVLREQHGHDAWCHGFRYHIKLASRQSDITAQDTVDKKAELVLFRDGEVVQRVNGIVRSFSVGGTGHQHTHYELILVPAIERLSLRHNSRIFQLKNAQDIITQLMLEMDIQDFVFATMRVPKQREFCMQYRETDLAFILRLAAEEGMMYYIEQSAGKHTIVFSDDTQTVSKQGAIPYNASSGGVSDTPYIAKFIQRTQFEVSETRSGDSSFAKPQYTFSQRAMGNDLDYQRDTYQHYDAPGRFKDDATGKIYNQYRLEGLRRRARTAHGESDAPLIQAGVRFELQEHNEQSFNRDWLVIASHHKGDQPQALEESAGSQPTTYSNTFEVIPTNRTWRMPQATRPQVDGLMTAYVVGPSSEEIFCDDYGRVRLHFPWDRESEFNEHSSCWIPVSQGWAGNQYGMIAVPRIGQEVLVSFLNGDPDQPIVTGRAFNAKNLPPYPLPDNKTKTVWRSQTHQGEGFNEISFEDQSNSEQVYVRAQKDFRSETLNDHITDVNNDQHLTVENDQFTQIKNNHNLTVEADSATSIKGDSSQEIGGSFQQKTGQAYIVDAAQEVSLISGGKVVIEAGAEITLKVGGSFVKVDAAGVHLVGPGINLNSGGSAGKSSTYSGAAPQLPKGIAALQAPATSVAGGAIAMTTVTQASIVSICGKQTDGSCLKGEQCQCKR